MNNIPLLRNSERESFRRCLFKWHWQYNEDLVPIELKTGPLVFGSFGHLALAAWYQPGMKRGIHPAETWDSITQDYRDDALFIDDDIEGAWEDARKLGHDMLVNYVDEYGNDPQWEVLWVERPGRQFIPHPKLGGNALIVEYCFTLDLIVRDHSQNGRVRYVDHKFMKSIETEHLNIDSQNGGYLAIGTHQLRQEGIIGPKESVRDLIYNFLRKSRPPDKPRNAFGEYLNQDGSVSKRQPPPFFERYAVSKTPAERNQQITAIGNEALAMKAFRTGKLPLYKSPRRDCKWDCQFFNLCQAHESNGDVEEIKRVLFRKENGYLEYADGAKSPKRLEG